MYTIELAIVRDFPEPVLRTPNGTFYKIQELCDGGRDTVQPRPASDVFLRQVAAALNEYTYGRKA